MNEFGLNENNALRTICSAWQWNMLRSYQHDMINYFRENITDLADHLQFLRFLEHHNADMAYKQRIATSALKLAVKMKRLDDIYFLGCRGADVSTVGNEAILLAIEAENVELVKMLLRRGGFVMSTEFHIVRFALRHGKLQIAKCLLGLHPTRRKRSLFEIGNYKKWNTKNARRSRSIPDETNKLKRGCDYGKKSKNNKKKNCTAQLQKKCQKHQSRRCWAKESHKWMTEVM